ncbi:MAG: DNA-processing protein DprA [Acidimicrobiales bacterium]
MRATLSPVEVGHRRYEQACLLALSEAGVVPDHRLARLVERVGSARAVIDGAWGSVTPPSRSAQDEDLGRRVTPAMIDRWQERIVTVTGGLDTDLVTVLDPDYPENLRRVHNRPPFLFVRGSLLQGDRRAVAVVGTRRPSLLGREVAREWAGGLARAGVTVVSGLAAGIDTLAHQEALGARGRTLACLGTGIDLTYPPENKDLAERIGREGARVSRFWPGTPPRRQNFPQRNVVTSGLAVGTLVIEASAHSGARMQARLALEHNKRLYLPTELVAGQEWAAGYAERPGALVVACVAEVIADVDDILATQGGAITQLRLL